MVCAALASQDAAGGCQPAVLAGLGFVQAVGVLLDQVVLDAGLGRCPTATSFVDFWQATSARAVACSAKVGLDVSQRLSPAAA